MCEVPGSIPGWALFFSLCGTTFLLMSTSLLPHLPLSLDLTQHTRWTATQENAIHTYPFADQFEGVDSEHGHEDEQEHQEQDQANHHAVVRVYLQFLWLPEVRVIRLLLL
jgi:hypothetical protein